MLSLRQRVFNWLDKNPEAKNKALYFQFKGNSESSLRQYKMQYSEELSSESFNGQMNRNYETFIKSIKMDLMNRTGKTLFSEVSELTELDHKKYNNRKKSVKNDVKNYHIFPLLKTFKLLPLYIFLKVYEISKEIKDPEVSITDIYHSVIDTINAGIYDISTLSDFSYNCTSALRGFLDHESWKTSTINKVNVWLELEKKVIYSNYKTGEIRTELKCNGIKANRLKCEYQKIKGSILTSFLPEFYGIYYYTKSKDLIVKDFSKACFLNNLVNDKPISLTQLIDKYNDDLEFRERPNKYHIYMDYNEPSE